MVISWILVAFFLFVILGEMYFIGKYISITQDIFSNKNFATFALGAAVYIFISFLIFIPFATLNVSPIYFAIIIIIKDFFTIVFLIARREKFKGMKLNWIPILFLLLAGILMPILFEFVIPYIYKPSNLTISNEYQTWTKFFEPAFTHLTKFNIDDVRRFMFAPLAGVIVYSCVAALLLNFYNKELLRGYILAMVVSIGFVILFNYKLNLYEMIGPALILVLFLSAYNLIMFSRRRYGSMFGMVVASIWSTMPQLFWTMLIFAFATSITYAYLKKPKALVFTVQLVAPVLIVAAFWVGDFSRALSLVIAIFGVVAYALIFLLGRIHFLEGNSKWVTVINYAWPIAVISTIFILAIVYGFRLDKVNKDILITNNTLFDTFNNDIVELVQNILYYSMLVLLLMYTVVLALRKDRILKLKLAIIMALFTFLFGYNPGFQAIMIVNNWEREYELVRLVAIAPIFIIAIAQIKKRKTKAEIKSLA